MLEASAGVATAHLVSTLLMVGLILFVQVVHYPLMARVGPGEFVRYEAGHTSRTGLVVIPLMLTELGTGVLLAFHPPASPYPLSVVDDHGRHGPGVTDEDVDPVRGARRRALDHRERRRHGRTLVE